MEFFRQVQWAFKFSDANVQVSFSRSVKGTPLMPRDLFLMAASGRMHRVIDEAGRSWWSVAAIKNVSDALDVIAQLEGQLMVRGSDLWKPVPIGSDNQVLTFNAVSGLPEWRDPSGGGGITWGAITGTLSDQTDLEAALADASARAAWGSITGTLTDQLDLVAALAAAGGSPAWGDITGTLSDQTDLQAALDAADDKAKWGHITGTLSDQTDLEAALADKVSLTTGNTIGGTNDFSGNVDVAGTLTIDGVPVSTSGGAVTGKPWYWKPPAATAFNTPYDTFRGGLGTNTLSVGSDSDVGMSWYDTSLDSGYMKTTGRPIPGAYVGGNFDITAHIISGMIQANEQLGIWARCSSSKYVFLDLFNRGGTLSLQRCYYNGTWQDGIFSEWWNDRDVWLRISISGQTTSYYVSHDGKHFLQIYATENLLTANYHDYGFCYGRFDAVPFRGLCDHLTSQEFP